MRDGRNLLLVSPFFYPESISTGKYNTVLAESLVERGARVTVIASHPLYPGWRPKRSESALGGMTILRGGAGVRYPKSAVMRRVVLESWFAWHSFWRALWLRGRFDVVVAVLPPSMFALVLTAMFPKACKVGIVHDLQGVHAKSHGGLVARMAGAIERAAFRRFDRLIFLSKSMAVCAAQAGGFAEGKAEVCYPFVTVKPGAQRGVLEALFPQGSQHVVYAGALGKKQSPDRLLKVFEAAALCLPNVVFHVFSEGPEFDRLQREHEGCGAIAFHPLVAEEDLAELYARSDVQVIPQMEGTAEGAFPSKLPNLLASGCAVLAICDRHSELNEVIRAAGTGAAQNDWEIAGIVESLRSLLERVSQESHAERARLAEPVVREMFGMDRLLDCILEESEAAGSGEFARGEEPQLT